MTKRSLAALICALLLTLALAAGLLVFLLLTPGARMAEDGMLTPVSFTGTLALPDGTAAGAVAQDRFAELNGEEKICASGHFSIDLPAGTILMLRLRDVRAVMRVNGREVFAYGREGTFPANTKSPGDVWYCYTSDGIARTDLVEIQLEHVYDNTSINAYETFFGELYAGSPQSLLMRQLGENQLSFLIGTVACSFGVLVLAIAIVARCFHLPYVRQMLLFAGVVFGGGVWMLFDFSYISLLIPYPAFNTTVAYLGLYFLPVFLLLYCRTYLTGWRKRTALFGGISLLVLLCCVIVLQACGVRDLVEFQLPAVGLLIVSLLLITVLLLLEPGRRKAGRRAQLALLSVLPMLVGILADTVNFWFGSYRTTVGLHISLLFFSIMQVGVLMNALQENARRSLQLEHDLLQSRVMMMLSQIKPHFLYNSLTAIKQLCATDPPRAEEAVGDFANYLRSNLDSLSSDTLIPLSRELAHTECYLKLEQMRFGDRVRVMYDLRYNRFSVPSLTIQPLVENAVRYGITKKPGGGTVTIFADETEEEYIVRVSDDGVGFDPSVKPKSGDRSHIGLDNVKSRIAAMCEGTMQIESAPGKGTTATIRIPKRDASEED